MTILSTKYIHAHLMMNLVLTLKKNVSDLVKLGAAGVLLEILTNWNADKRELKMAQELNDYLEE